MNSRTARLAAIVAGAFLSSFAGAAEKPGSAPIPVPIPGGEGGLRLDDLYFDRALGKLVLPAARTGQLDLIDPNKREFTAIEGFAAPPKGSTGPASGGRAAVLELDHDGRILSSLQGPNGLDIIAFSRELSHVYLPGGKAGRLMIAALSDDGTLAELSSMKTSPGVRAVAADDRGGIWLCDGAQGRLLYLKDPN
ncbi:MAG: hypothetical protein NTX64_13180 [Elusimicrobia bacterium]|nr:hypothetical protein [Elusimicrobiota bacterium]